MRYLTVNATIDTIIVVCTATQHIMPDNIGEHIVRYLIVGTTINTCSMYCDMAYYA